MNQFLQFAKEVLETSATPLIYQEIWKKGLEMGLDRALETVGKTPWQTLGARLFVEVRDNSASLFVKVGRRPARFFLKSKLATLTQETISQLDRDETAPGKSEKTSFTERDLHPLLSYFAATQFKRGKEILTKTIFHEKSKKNGLSEWTHPDMVGVYLPIEDWNPEIFGLNSISSSNALTLYSFELKKEIDRRNYREYFFQAVSNSSWANEGYLVAGKIASDDELLTELERLSTSFGIGLIELDLEDIDTTRIVFHAQKKKELDWETMNKLSEINRDFQKFLQDVKIDFGSKIHRAEYDEVLKEPNEYLRKITGKEK